MLDRGTLFECSIDDGFRRDSLSTTLSFVGCNENAGLTILNTIAKRFRRETSENDRVNSSNTRTRKESLDTCEFDVLKEAL